MPNNILYLLVLMASCMAGCNSDEEIVCRFPAPNKVSFSAKIKIQPYDEIEDSTLKFVTKGLVDIYDANITVLPYKELPADAWYAERHRYWADTLLKHLKKLSSNTNVYVIGITGKDISTKKSKYPNWGVMGLDYMPGNACVISDYRLQAFPKTREHIDSQLLKVAIHELGHNFGLPHCPNETCYMTDAEGKNKLDGETGFCKKCKEFLSLKNVWLNDKR